jgi:LmbE family N-acetylglucosaminyl deacetylase
MRILAIGGHPDDIFLYCAGTLLRLLDEGNEVRTMVCTNGESRGGLRIAEERKANKLSGIKESYFLEFPDGSLSHGLELISAIDKVVLVYDPDIVLSHNELDTHQDHVAVYKAVRSANRNWDFNWLTYESYDIRNGFMPNLFVDISKYYDKKLELLNVYESQQGRWYFNDGVISARSLGAKAGERVERFRIEYFSI